VPLPRSADTAPVADPGRAPPGAVTAPRYRRPRPRAAAPAPAAAAPPATPPPADARRDRTPTTSMPAAADVSADDADARRRAGDPFASAAAP
jgi:hypothetical protein